MNAPAIQTLTPGQIELLIMLTFQHLPQSQKTMLPLLGSHWQREQLQIECARLTELGWLSVTSGRRGVPPELQERVARYAWRNDLLPQQSAPDLTVRGLEGSSEARRRITRQLRTALYTGDTECFVDVGAFGSWAYQFVAIRTSFQKEEGEYTWRRREGHRVRPPSGRKGGSSLVWRRGSESLRFVDAQFPQFGRQACGPLFGLTSGILSLDNRLTGLRLGLTGLRLGLTGLRRQFEAGG